MGYCAKRMEYLYALNWLSISRSCYRCLFATKFQDCSMILTKLLSIFYKFTYLNIRYVNELNNDNLGLNLIFFIKTTQC